MALYANPPKDGNFVRILAPRGIRPAICCDVVDRGLQEQNWKGNIRQVPKVSIHWLLPDIIPEKWTHPYTGVVVDVPEDLVGRPFGITRWFTNSMSERAALRQQLGHWRGKPLTDAEANHFDLERLIGQPAGLMIVHTQDKHDPDKWYANVDVVTTLPDGFTAPEIPGDYVRIKDRPPRDGETPEQPAPVGAQQPMSGPPPMWEGGPSETPLSEPDDDLPF